MEDGAYRPTEAVAMYGSGLNRASANEVPIHLSQLEIDEKWRSPTETAWMTGLDAGETPWDQSYLGGDHGSFRGIPAVISGWRRVFKQSSYRNPEQGRGVLNIEADEDSFINTVIYIPSEDERDDLIQRESGYGTTAVDPADVTTYFEEHQDWIEELDEVYLFHDPDAAVGVPPNPEYVAICVEGARYWREIINTAEGDRPLKKTRQDVGAETPATGDFLQDFLQTTHTAEGTLTDWLTKPEHAEQVVSYLEPENYQPASSVDDWLQYDDEIAITVDEDPYADVRKWRASVTGTEPVDDDTLREEARWMDQRAVPEDIRSLVAQLTR